MNRPALIRFYLFFKKFITICATCPRVAKPWGANCPLPYHYFFVPHQVAVPALTAVTFPLASTDIDKIKSPYHREGQAALATCSSHAKEVKMSSINLLQQERVRFLRRTYTPFRCRAPCRGRCVLRTRWGAALPKPLAYPQERNTRFASVSFLRVICSLKGRQRNSKREGEQRWDLAKKEYLIQECLAGRMRMRARCAGVLHSTMLSRHRAEGAPALSENENAQRRTYRTEIRQKAVEEYLSGLGRAMAIAEKYKLRSGNLVLECVKEYHRHRESPKETGGISMTSRKHTLEERVQAVRERPEVGKNFSELSERYSTTVPRWYGIG